MDDVVKLNSDALDTAAKIIAGDFARGTSRTMEQAIEYQRDNWKRHRGEVKDAVTAYLNALAALSPRPDRSGELEERWPTLAKDPNAVHLAMLRGDIAKPTIRQMLHVHGADALNTWDRATKAEADNARLREAVLRLRGGSAPIGPGGEDDDGNPLTYVSPRRVKKSAGNCEHNRAALAEEGSAPPVPAHGSVPAGELQDGWRTMDSAPKDRIIDIWGAERDRYKNERIPDCFWFDGAWKHLRTIYDPETPDEYAPVFNVEYWRERPPPPTAGNLAAPDPLPATGADAPTGTGE